LFEMPGSNVTQFLRREERAEARHEKGKPSTGRRSQIGARAQSMYSSAKVSNRGLFRVLAGFKRPSTTSAFLRASSSLATVRETVPNARVALASVDEVIVPGFASQIDGHACLLLRLSACCIILVFKSPPFRSIFSTVADRTVGTSTTTAPLGTTVLIRLLPLLPACKERGDRSRPVGVTRLSSIIDGCNHKMRCREELPFHRVLPPSLSKVSAVAFPSFRNARMIFSTSPISCDSSKVWRSSSSGIAFWP
jgi:hypothetical protein